MDAQDDVMGSDAARSSRAPSSEPSSLARRESMADACSSPTRKRPRLDSGDRAVRSMSADTVLASSSRTRPEEIQSPVSAGTHVEQEQTSAASPSAQAAASSSASTFPAQQHPPPSQVTINVRSQHQVSEPGQGDRPAPSSPPDRTCSPDHLPAGRDMECQPRAGSPQQGVARNQDVNLAESPNDDLPGSPSSVSMENNADSPVVEIEAGEPEDMDEDGADQVIQIDGEEDLLSLNLFQNFPFTEKMGTPLGAIAAVGKHFSEEPVDPNVVTEVTTWLEQQLSLLQNRKSEWPHFYKDNGVFWNEVAVAMIKLTRRRHPFGADLFDHAVESEDGVLQKLITVYVRLFARLVQIDADTLENADEDVDVDRELLLQKHWKVILNVFQCQFKEAPIWNQFQALFHLDIEELSLSFMSEFIRSPSDGLHHLARLAKASLRRAAVDQTGANNAILAGRLADVLCRRSYPGLGRIFAGWTSFPKDGLKFFRAVDELLQQSADKQAGQLPVEVSRELLSPLGECLLRITEQSDSFASELFNEYVGSTDLATYHFCPTVVRLAWKLRLLKKYITKGRMELRVWSVELMNNELLTLWRTFHQSPPGIGHPVMQYFASFLLEEHIIGSIIGVDSHPQLISRSSNIVGFLMVTHRYDDSMTDMIWQRGILSLDPRVVSATINMFSQIANLMDMHMLLYICGKLHDLPIEAYGPDVRFLSREIFERIRLSSSEFFRDDGRIKAYDLCIRLITEGCCGGTHPNASAAFEEGCRELRGLCDLSSLLEHRQFVYETCVREIKEGPSRAVGGRMRAIHIASERFVREDINLLARDLDLTRIAVEEMCSFVDSERPKPRPHPFTMCLGNPLTPRMGLLCVLIGEKPDSVPEELYDTLWEHLVGTKAIDSSARDQCWSHLAQLLRSQNKNQFLDRCISEHLPKLEPRFFTLPFFSFVQQAFEYQWRAAMIRSAGEEITEVPGVELLWHIIVTAHEGTIETHAAQFLAGVYLDPSKFQRTTLPKIETIHEDVVERCMRQLKDAFVRCRSLDAEAADAEDARMGSSTPDIELQQHRQRFGRTIVILTTLLELVRAKPEFAIQPRRLSRETAPSVVGESEPIAGDPIVIKYQAHNGKSTDMQSMTVGDLETLSDLQQRFASKTGFPKFTVIVGGRRWDLDHDETIRESQIATKGAFMIKRAADVPYAPRGSVSSAAGQSVIEREVLRHFDELYAFMDGDDCISEIVHKFLLIFPAHEKVREAVLREDVSVSAVFPPGQIFRTSYSIRALHSNLRQQIAQNTADEPFLAHGIRLCTAGLMSNELVSESLSGPRDVDISTVLIECLHAFLKECSFQDFPQSNFEDPVRFVRRVTAILNLAMMDPSKIKATYECYATLLDAALRDSRVWDAFTSSPEVVDIHRRLLLEDERLPLRVEIMKCIENFSKAYPDSAAVADEEFNIFYWRILSSILPHVQEHPRGSRQYFNIANAVFSKVRNQEESTLRAYLSDWGSMLLDHKHEEVVGRDEVDDVVLGLVKLLLSCVRSLKSFKKPLNCRDLMERIFVTFLFPPFSPQLGGRTVDDEDDEIIDDGAQGAAGRKAVGRDEVVEAKKAVPVLETYTRKELYDLTLALCEDLKAYRSLTNLMTQILPDYPRVVPDRFNVDRSKEFRCPNGYLGIRNLATTCYMNSLLTQLYMNLGFRTFVLSKNFVLSGESQTLLSETQRLFAYMQNSFDKATNANDFACTVRTIDNQQIDVQVQMDAEEFFNLVFDQWESQMLTTAAKNAFRSFYGGQTVNQIKSRECQHVSERTESFFAIQCDVKGKGNLTESLRSFVEGDVMEGENKYKCESCGGRFVNAVKRTCLKDVPDNLIFHLKRFDFDLATMMRSKINERFEFPMQIDLGPYMVDHLNDPEAHPPKQDVFVLVGVLVHSGTADSGHYYSFIRVRPTPGDATAHPGVPSPWMQFNDADVTPFDPNRIPDECFGGWVDTIEPQGADFHQQATLPKTSNAYMLFYQRASTLQQMPETTVLGADPTIPAVVPVPKEIGREIDADNERRLRQHCLFDPCYVPFVRQLVTHLRALTNNICTEDHHLEHAAIGIAIRNLHQIVSRTKDLPELFSTMELVRKWTFGGCIDCCVAVLRAFIFDPQFLRDLLLRAPLFRLRSEVSAFLVDALQHLRAMGPALYGVEQSPDSSPSDGDGEPFGVDQNGLFACVVERLGEYMDYLSFHRNWNEYFHTLARIAEFGNNEACYLIGHGFLKRCLSILVVHSPYSKQTRFEYHSLLKFMEKKKPQWEKLSELVSVLVRRLDLDPTPTGDDEQERAEIYDGISLPWSHTEAHLMLLWDPTERASVWLARIFDTWEPKFERFVPGEITTHLCRCGPSGKLYLNLRMTIRDGIDTLNANFVEPYVKAGVYFCLECPDLSHALEIIDTVIANAENSAAESQPLTGPMHLDFLDQIAGISNQNPQARSSPYAYCYRIMDRSPAWAGGLLMSTDERVRLETVFLLERLLFSHVPVAKHPEGSNEQRMDIYRVKVARALCNSLGLKLASAYDAEYPRRAMQPMADTLSKSIEFLRAAIDLGDDSLLPYGDERAMVDRSLMWLNNHHSDSSTTDAEGEMDKLEWQANEEELGQSEDWASDYSDDSNDM
ncbi:hypothetical protein BDY21DRAFT_380132 [Lineolata rhizophorae]|uniref:USP domain-containing protein n=1 Tax=Lineolata rhizophorae TaxID=578093 RepID=A0A6A6NXZ6_9PEZI|nr:hypothetical protein BDY21DRAFT_380132 [Lineolata rhizophorae]